MSVTGQSSWPNPMGGAHWADLEQICPERVSYGVPMSRLTTLRIGGSADVLVRPTTAEEVARVIRWVRQRQVPLFVMGRGSNLLVGDGGIRGVVLQLAPPMDRWKAGVEGTTIYLWAQAGLPLRRLMREGLRRGWGGMEFLVGIPGYLGGAVAMNAGTPQEGIGQLVKTILWVDPDGELVTKERKALEFSYRKLELPHGCVIVEAHLRLFEKDAWEIRESLRERMRRRRQNQPCETSSAGSIFKNPPGDSAGRIIDEMGLKGLTVGGAQISKRHANFIVNLGGATARDVLALIHEVRRRVAQGAGTDLELELQIVGEAS